MSQNKGKLPKGFKHHRKYEPFSPWQVSYEDEILCPHGIGHSRGVHGCDGCCTKLTGVVSQNTKER